MNSFLLLCEISGFPPFEQDPAAVHGRCIVDELQERIIDADTVGLTVVDVESDVVLFYREAPPPMEDLLEQVRRIFLVCHTHLRQYEAERLCACAACVGAVELKIRFVVHRGPVSLLRVKGIEKPYGAGVLLARRLLRNDVPVPEYLLLTDGFPRAASHERTGWTFVDGKTTFPNLGDARYRYASLESLRAEIPDPDPPSRFAAASRPIVYQGVIDRPVDQVYELLSNLDLRTRWSPAIKDLVYEPDRVNRVGTRHEALVRGEPMEFETVVADLGGDGQVFGERVDDPPLVRGFTVLWVLHPEGKRTRARLELYTEPPAYPERLLMPLYRLGARRELQAAFRRLKTFAERP